MPADDLFVSGALIALFVLYALLALMTVGEFILGLYVLRRGGDSFPARLLGVYLILQPFSWGIILASIRIRAPGFSYDGFFQELGLGNAWPIPFAALAIMAYLPAILVGFALTYLVPAGRLGKRKVVAGVLALPPTGLWLWSVHDQPWSDPAQWNDRVSVLLLFGAIFGAVGTIAALALFLTRLRHTAARLERTRLRFMSWATLFPAGVGLIVALAFVLISGGHTYRTQNQLAALGGVLVLLFVPIAVVLIPALGIAYGLLRFRILDWDERVRVGLRVTLRSTVLASTFALAFFLATEVAQRLLVKGSSSQIIGLIGAGLLALGLRPLERAADRLATRVLPKRRDKVAVRRRELYRANYEEMMGDEQVTATERRALGTLARRLGLTADEVSTIEHEVRRENPGWFRRAPH